MGKVVKRSRGRHHREGWGPSEGETTRILVLRGGKEGAKSAQPHDFPSGGVQKTRRSLSRGWGLIWFPFALFYEKLQKKSTQGRIGGGREKILLNLNRALDAFEKKKPWGGKRGTCRSTLRLKPQGFWFLPRTFSDVENPEKLLKGGKEKKRKKGGKSPFLPAEKQTKARSTSRFCVGMRSICPVFSRKRRKGRVFSFFFRDTGNGCWPGREEVCRWAACDWTGVSLTEGSRPRLG